MKTLAMRLVLAAVLLVAAVFAVVRIARWRRERAAGWGPPPGHAPLWRCRATGFETNLPPEDVARFIGDGRAQRDPEKPWIVLLPCPDCGKHELEPMTVTPQGKVSL